jgi:hypothetical protein
VRQRLGFKGAKGYLVDLAGSEQVQGEILLQLLKLEVEVGRLNY